MAPHWAETAGWVFLGLGFASALAILVDELLLDHRQQMAVMNIVHPVTALYLGPVWLWAYFARGRRASGTAIEESARRLAREDADAGRLHRAAASTEPGELTRWHVANATSHCGAGCTLGDIGGEWIVWALGPWLLAGATLWPEIILDFPLAWLLGIVFQYLTIVPMRENVGKLQGLWLAVRADTLSIVAFQVGMYAWMILSAEVLWRPPLPIDSAAHWWMMQVAMIVGFVTAYPVNRWLVRIGWKEKMDRRMHVAERLEALRHGPGRGAAA